MKSVDLCVVFWNVWFHNELTVVGRDRVLERLGTLIELYKPDVFGLNEILWDHETDTAPILDFLAQRGYYVHFTKFHKARPQYSFGSAIASLKKPTSLQEYPLHKGTQQRPLLIATVPLAGSKSTIQIGVIHPASFARANGYKHPGQIKTLRRLLSEPGVQQRFILGGDLNEFAWMPQLWLDDSHFDHRTGSWSRPTWQWRGKPFLPLRYSLDHIFWSTDGSIDIKTFEILEREPSDHSPLLARFTVKM